MRWFDGQIFSQIVMVPFDRKRECGQETEMISVKQRFNKKRHKCKCQISTSCVGENSEVEKVMGLANSHTKSGHCVCAKFLQANNLILAFCGSSTSLILDACLID
jgi:hypothetical protein